MTIIQESLFDLLYNNGMLSVLVEAILMSTHNIQFHDKIIKFSLNICSLQLSEEFCRDSKRRIRISHGKRAIGFRAIEVRLYQGQHCLLIIRCFQTHHQAVK